MRFNAEKDKIFWKHMTRKNAENEAKAKFNHFMKALTEISFQKERQLKNN